MNPISTQRIYNKQNNQQSFIEPKKLKTMQKKKKYVAQGTLIDCRRNCRH